MPLSGLESALQAWLCEQMPLPADVGDISFDSPHDTWSAKVTRPTVNLFLFDIARAAAPSAPMPPQRDPGGGRSPERPAPLVSFSYLLSAWGGGVQEEHRLLGDAVRAVLRTPSLSPGPPNPDLLAPVQIELSETNEARMGQLWSGLGRRLRAGMVLVATTAIPLVDPAPPAAPVDPVRTAGTPRPPVERARTIISTRAGPGTVIITGTGVKDDSPRRFVWFGPRQPRGRGRA
jgi:hypothetical protein